MARGGLWRRSASRGERAIGVSNFSPERLMDLCLNSEADRKAIDALDLGYSEILDYRNPCIAKMFIRKKIME